MVPKDDQDMILDPVEMLNDVLEQIWHTLCCTYEATGDLPDIKTLFDGANLSKPFQAAKIVIVNMLMDVMENIGRFSPWYTRPARSFGLASVRDPVANSNRWILAPEAVQKWGDVLDRLSVAIEQNYSLIQAMIYVEGLMEDVSPGDKWVIAYCQCKPPRSIQVTQSVLAKAEILCDACMQPFR
ncbi:MAG: hypothetical protein JXA78_02595 [Anaerolineales bacterium]|nr:hypothetical protein [Anaerolineales bacterium]